MISHEHKCIFIHIPKCAGTSIEAALGHLGNHGGRGGQDHRNIRMIEQPLLTPAVLSSKENIFFALHRLRRKYKKLSNPQNKITVSTKQYKSYYKFTIVRNPWARAYSWYKNVMRDEMHQKSYKVNDQISLNAFLKLHAGKLALRTQTYWIKDFKGAIPLDFIGRFETINDDFQQICEAMKIPDITLPHNIKGSGEDYREHYDEASIKIIEEVYKEEIEMFDYSFES